jgi:hypothetical protein
MLKEGLARGTAGLDVGRFFLPSELGERGDFQGARGDMGEFSSKGVPPAAPCPPKSAWEFYLYLEVLREIHGELFGVWG